MPRFQWIGTEFVKTTPSANSNEMVTAESLSTCKNPLVGPVPIVLGVVSTSPSPSASCGKPVRVTSAVKIPELTSVQ